MGKPYVCLAEEAASELVIKKSRFLCRLVPVETEQQAAAALGEVRKEHYNARHNCFAMILGANRNFEKSSDDGEPQGTAGVPMLEVLRKSGLTNILAVVTRYFGGTLLGAGGLVRAYGGAVSEALRTAKREAHIPAVVLRLRIDYADYGKLQSIAAEYGAKVEADYGEKVEARAVFRQADYDAVAKRITEAFLGADVYEKDGECYLTEQVVPQEPTE